VHYAKQERYALMEEEVSILKALWTTRGPVNFQGKFHTLSGAHIRPRPLAAAVSEILSRRRLARSLGNVGEAFRRASVLGRSAGTHRGQHRRDQGDGTGA